MIDVDKLVIALVTGDMSESGIESEQMGECVANFDVIIACVQVAKIDKLQETKKTTFSVFEFRKLVCRKQTI